MAGLMLSPVGEVVKSSAPSIRAKVVDFGLVKHYWAFALFLAVVHSLVEEYYWRWFVFGRLRLMTGAWPAHLLAAAAFASHHVVMAVQFFPWGWGLFFGAAVGAGGLIWSLMLSRQKSLAGIWLSHMIVDLGILSIGHKLVFETWL
jgi:membrane protease YdiL (CAAX protease family)